MCKRVCKLTTEAVSLLECDGIYQMTCAKLKLTNELEHGGTYLRNDVHTVRCIDKYMYIQTNIDRSRGMPFEKCGAHSGSPQLKFVYHIWSISLITIGVHLVHRPHLYLHHRPHLYLYPSCTNFKGTANAHISHVKCTTVRSVQYICTTHFVLHSIY